MALLLGQGERGSKIFASSRLSALVDDRLEPGPARFPLKASAAARRIFRPGRRVVSRASYFGNKSLIAGYQMFAMYA